MKDHISLFEASKRLNVSRKALSVSLHNHNVFMHQNGRYLPKYDYIKNGFFKIDSTNYSAGVVTHHAAKVLVSYDGMEWLKAFVKLNSVKKAA